MTIFETVKPSIVNTCSPWAGTARSGTWDIMRCALLMRQVKDWHYDNGVGMAQLVALAQATVPTPTTKTGTSLQDVGEGRVAGAYRTFRLRADARIMTPIYTKRN